MARILIAENESLFQDAELLLLDSMGHEVVHFESGRDASHAVIEDAFDLLLVNQTTADINAQDMVTLLHQIGFDAPVLVIADEELSESERSALKSAGCRGLIHRPIDLESLQEQLQTLFETEEGDDAAVDTTADSFLDDELMQLFVDRTRILRAEMIAALDQSDWDGVRNTAHTVKGSGSTFGFPLLTALGKEICDLIDHEQIDTVPGLTRQLVEEMRKVLPDDA